jgi:hypothetical protein
MALHARFVALAAVAAALLAPSASAAGQTIEPSAEPGRGPVLAGDQVLWTQQGDGGLDLYSATPGGKAHRITRVYTDPTDEEQGDNGGTTYNSVGALAGAPGVAALWVSSTFDKYFLYNDALHAGPIGPLGPSIASASGDQFNGPPCSGYSTFDLAAASDAVVYVANSSCQQPHRGQVYLQTLPKTGDSVSIDPDARAASSVHIAGRWVAWRRALDAGTELAVYDRNAAAIAYKVPGPANSFDVDEEGRLAVARPDGSVAWYSPADQTAHPVALDGVSRVAARGGRIAYERAGDTGIRLGTIDLAPGSQPIELATLPPLPEPATPSWDFDGQKLAWLDPGCLYGSFQVESQLTGTSAPAPAHDCRVVFRSPVLRPGRTGRMSVRLECPEGCSGRVVMTAPRLFRGRRSTALAKSGTGVVTIPLKVRERRKLDRLKRVPARLVAQLDRGESSTESSRAVTIRRR